MGDVEQLGFGTISLVDMISVMGVLKADKDMCVQARCPIIIPSTTRGLKYLNPRVLSRVGSEMVLGPL